MEFPTDGGITNTPEVPTATPTAAQQLAAQRLAALSLGAQPLGQMPWWAVGIFAGATWSQAETVTISDGVTYGYYSPYAGAPFLSPAQNVLNQQAEAQYTGALLAAEAAVASAGAAKPYSPVPTVPQGVVEPTASPNTSDSAALALILSIVQAIKAKLGA